MYLMSNTIFSGKDFNELVYIARARRRSQCIIFHACSCNKLLQKPSRSPNNTQKILSFSRAVCSTPPLLPRCSSTRLFGPFEILRPLHANFYKRQNYYQNDLKPFEYVYGWTLFNGEILCIHGYKITYLQFGQIHLDP